MKMSLISVHQLIRQKRYCSAPHPSFSQPETRAVTFRPYQQAAFDDRSNGLEIWLWGRQTGKSFTLAAWAVDRLIQNPGRLVTILSNSKSNGMELNLKCAEVCRHLQVAFEQLDLTNPWVGRAPRVSNSAPPPSSSSHGVPPSGGLPNPKSAPCVKNSNHTTLRETQKQRGASDSLRALEAQSEIRNQKSRILFDYYHYETRITINGLVGRIKVLPANPRTARGFSGDLILDEFAFHENSAAIWEAAEPILAANPDFLCRVASTPNGRHNMFYRLATDPNIPLRKVSRSDAYDQGLHIFHPVTREPITPEQARDLALDKRAYDQNYECLFETENMALLTYELILAAERENIGLISRQSWSPETLPFLRGAYASGVSRSASAPNDPPHGVPPSGGPSIPQSEIPNRNPELYLGIDVGRSRDLTVITVLEKSGQSLLVRAILRMHDTRLPDQQEQLAAICRLPGFRRACIDMTGLGLGLFEYTQKQFGSRIRGINFAAHLPLQPHSPLSIRNEKSGIRNGATAPAPEVLALGLLAAYEDRRLQHPIDEQLREDLRKPERVVTPSGRVSIAATRDGAGHADHFWSLALAVHAAQAPPDIYIHVVPREKPFHRIDRRRLM